MIVQDLITETNIELGMQALEQPIRQHKMNKIKTLLLAKKHFKNWQDYLLACYGKRHEMVTKDGSTVFLRDPKDADIIKSIWFYNEYGLDPKKEYQTIVDVGAHAGFFSLFARKNYPYAKIYSYEPLKANFEVLVKNTKDHGITCNNNAVSDSSGATKLYKHERHTASSVVMESESFDIVSSLTLYDIIKEVERISLLKLDCEGAEHEILKSDLSLVDEIRMEYHDIPEKNHSTLIMILQDAGFSCKHIPVTETLGRIYATRTKTSAESE